MVDMQSIRSLDPADALFRSFLEKIGLGRVECMACVRALLPQPFDWESYTYTATGGQSWTWDVYSARALTRARPQTNQLLIRHTELSEILRKQSRIDEQHLHHIPLEKLEEPILLAPVPDGHGHTIVDGSHRATVQVRAHRDVYAILLTPAESLLAIEVAPLAMHRIAIELQRQGLLEPDR